MTIQVGLISDTHVGERGFKIPNKLETIFRDVQLILHAGDILDPNTLVELSRIAPVVAVQGNNDFPEIQEILPLVTTVFIQGHQIALIHQLGNAKTRPMLAQQLFPQADCVVYGHSHIPNVQKLDGKLLVNPGSPTDRRTQPDRTVGILTIGETIEARIIAL